MQKIKIMTDSASDVSPEYSKEYNIKVIGFHIIVGDKEYREFVDMTTHEFYELLENSEELPHTSQITLEDYIDAYNEAYLQGYTDLINVTISSTGSNSYNNAIMARDKFFEENPSASDKITITVMDSKGYTGVYGFPVIEAAKKIQKGDSLDTVVSFLQDWFDSGIILCTAYTLKYAKKSGRVNCVAAFVGEVLGLKPIIMFVDAVSETIDKIRGNKNILPRMTEIALEKMVPQTPYAILVGSNKETADELAEMLTKRLGYKPSHYLQVGATISCHLGHDVAGVIIKGENRR